MRLSASPVGYIGWLMLLQSLCVPAFALVRRRDVLAKQPPRILLTGLLAGALSVLAYGLVLWAQTRGALAPIAALRETSVIFGAIIGTLVFREPFGRARIAATVLVAAGILLLNVALAAASHAGECQGRPSRSPATRKRTPAQVRKGRHGSARRWIVSGSGSSGRP